MARMKFERRDSGALKTMAGQSRSSAARAGIFRLLSRSRRTPTKMCISLGNVRNLRGFATDTSRVLACGVFASLYESSTITNHRAFGSYDRNAVNACVTLDPIRFVRTSRPFLSLSPSLQCPYARFVSAKRQEVQVIRTESSAFAAKSNL